LKRVQQEQLVDTKKKLESASKEAILLKEMLKASQIQIKQKDGDLTRHRNKVSKLESTITELRNSLPALRHNRESEIDSYYQNGQVRSHKPDASPNRRASLVSSSVSGMGAAYNEETPLPKQRNRVGGRKLRKCKRGGHVCPGANLTSRLRRRVFRGFRWSRAVLRH
jgi:hypothetical protein